MIENDNEKPNESIRIAWNKLLLEIKEYTPDWPQNLSGEERLQ